MTSEGDCDITDLCFFLVLDGKSVSGEYEGKSCLLYLFRIQFKLYIHTSFFLNICCVDLMKTLPYIVALHFRFCFK